MSEAVLTAAKDEIALGAGLYVHVPFCVRKCRYCDFNSYAAAPAAIAEYLAAVQEELSLLTRQPEVSATRFTTLFIGGGTPTILPDDELAGLIMSARRSIRLDELPESAAEITVEANPGTVAPAKLAAMRAGRANRLSLGVQSFDPRVLQALGRIHDPAQAGESLTLARQAGFANINIDLMFGVPEQDVAGWQATLQRSLALQPEHISCYSLIVEPGTPLAGLVAGGQVALPDEDTELAMYDTAIGMLTDAGYIHYEISNFARPGYNCRHNLNYWHNGAYIGVGPGAHSCWQGRRLANAADPAAYARRVLAGLPAAVESTAVTAAAAMDETMILGLRLLAGVSLRRFRERFGCRVADVYGAEVEKLQKQGLVEMVAGRLRLTRRGLPLGNQVFAAFLRDS